MPPAFFARVRAGDGLRARHTWSGDLLPAPRVVVVTSPNDEREGWFLIRYAADGAFGGDTWHQSVDEAKRQAEWEYKDRIEEWRTVPLDEPDPSLYALRFVEQE